MLLGLILILLVALVPLKVGALLVGARRDGLVQCLLALIVAWFFVGVLHLFVRHGLLLSVLTSALAYMLVLETTYLKALAIAAIQLVLTWLFVLVVGAALVGPMMYRVFRV